MTNRLCQACGAFIDALPPKVRYCSEACRRRTATLRAQAWDAAHRSDPAYLQRQREERARYCAKHPDKVREDRRRADQRYRSNRTDEQRARTRNYQAEWYRTNGPSIRAARREAVLALPLEEQERAREARLDYMRSYHQARQDRLRDDPAAYAAARKVARARLRKWRHEVEAERMMADLATIET